MEKIIYQFWTGSNQMSHDRQMAFNTNTNIKNVNIKLITPENIRYMKLINIYRVIINLII